jgi:hypothetical protein
MARRAERSVGGRVVVSDVFLLDSMQRRFAFGTRVGELGQQLATHGITRALVSAGDQSVDASRPATMRRGAALAIADRFGGIDRGTMDGLLRSAPNAPFGVETDPDKLQIAVKGALRDAQVVVVEPGETLRADEFAYLATPVQTEQAKRRALERTDALIGRITALLRRDDVIYVVGVSSPLSEQADHLAYVLGHGAGIRNGWLTSPTTHRPGIVTLTDVAPTVLKWFGITTPSSMIGTPIVSVPAHDRRRLQALSSLDQQSVFDDQFTGVATKLLIGLLFLVAMLFALVVLASRSLRGALVWSCLAALALPLATVMVRFARVDRLPIFGATLVLFALTAVLATAFFRLPVVYWKAALALLVVSVASTATDLLAGAPLQLNAAFGYSPIAAGRFYGNSNVEYAVLVAGGILCVVGIAEVLRRSRLPLWGGGVLGAVVLLNGLPQYGANFGGVLAAVPAVLLTYSLGRGTRLRFRRLLASGGATLIAAVSATLVDLKRPPALRTHLGRFAAQVLSGHVSSVGETVLRKVQSNIGLLGSAWAWAVPVAVLTYVVLQGHDATAIRSIFERHRLVGAGLVGALVVGGLGLVFKDTGIWVLGMSLAIVVPFTVLLALEEHVPRSRQA